MLQDVQQQAMDVDEDDVRQAKKESLRAKFDLKDDMIDGQYINASYL